MQSAIAYHLTTCPQFVTFTGRNADWTDTHIPRTARPVRFGFIATLGPIAADGFYADAWYARASR